MNLGRNREKLFLIWKLQKMLGISRFLFILVLHQFQKESKIPEIKINVVIREINLGHLITAAFQQIFYKQNYS